LKPENCLLAKDDSGRWTAKLADFGADASRDSKEPELKPEPELEPEPKPEPEPGPEPKRVATKFHQWLGTYLWMPPEATGLNAEQSYPKGRVCAHRTEEKKYGPTPSIFGASDWFSFGIMLWEMWTEKLPHEGLGLAMDVEGHLTQQVWCSSKGKETTA
jgi:serine/threonine protein kinase